MNFCPVESDLDRMYRQADMREGKYKRIRSWLINSGRVEDAIVKAMQEDGEFDLFAAKHSDGFALIQLGLLALHPRPDFDPEWLKTCARKVCQDYIAQEFDAALDRLIDDQWLNWGDE